MGGYFFIQGGYYLPRMLMAILMEKQSVEYHSLYDEVCIWCLKISWKMSRRELSDPERNIRPSLTASKRDEKKSISFRLLAQMSVNHHK